MELLWAAILAVFVWQKAHLRMDLQVDFLPDHYRWLSLLHEQCDGFFRRLVVRYEHPESDRCLPLLPIIRSELSRFIAFAKRVDEGASVEEADAFDRDPSA